MKTLNYHYGPDRVGILLVFLISLSCSRDNDLKKDITCKLSLIEKNKVLIELQNHTNEYFYLPNGRGLIGGVRVFRIKGNHYVDYTKNFREDLYNAIFMLTEYEDCKRRIKIHNNLTNYQKDSLKRVIYCMNNISLNVNNVAVRDISEDILMIKPRDTIVECFEITKKLSKDTLVIFYQYPYKPSWYYKEYSEEIMQLLKRYSYIKTPDEILSYKQYKKIIQSNIIIYYPHKY